MEVSVPTKDEKLNGPKFNIHDKVFIKTYRSKEPSVVTAIGWDSFGGYRYVLDQYDPYISERDWEKEGNLVRQDDYQSFLTQEKLSKVSSLKEQIVKINLQIAELENQCQS